MRVALMTGCAQRALNTDINDATIRLLTRLGCEVVIAEGQGCCGALTHHMGKTEESHATAAKNIRAWHREMTGEGLDAVVINTSGCGTTVKDYGHMFRNEALAAEAKAVSEIAMDVSEVLMKLDLPEGAPKGLKIAYHAACSLQHGQQIKTYPKDLLKRAGFKVSEPVDSHLCCGSAGTYNLMQPEISGQLKERKVETLEMTKPDIIAAGNIGCMMQIGSGTEIPIVHTVELLDWATGGPRPPALDAPGKRRGAGSDPALRRPRPRVGHIGVQIRPSGANRPSGCLCRAEDVHASVSICRRPGVADRSTCRPEPCH
jgi:glycolate oxidase iron-sulfur subunit